MRGLEMLRALPREELLTGGHGAVPGCGAAIALRQALKALGPRTILCLATTSLAAATLQDLRTALRVPVVHAPPEFSVALAAGIRTALSAKGKRDVAVVSWAETAGAGAVLTEGLSSAAGRCDDLIHVCCEADVPLHARPSGAGFSGKQAGGAGLPGRHPDWRPDLVGLIAGLGASYSASASIAFPVDLITKMRKARGMRGFRYVHVLAPHPERCGCPPDRTVQMARTAVESGLWPLVEIDGGERRSTYHTDRRQLSGGWRSGLNEELRTE